MILLVVDVQRLIMTDALHNFEQFKNNVSNLINNARSNDIEVIQGEESDLTPGKIGFEVYEEFKPIDSEKLFIKKYNSAFKDTELDVYLKSKEIKDIAICGLQTDLCIDATVKCGLERGYNMIVVDGCNTTVDNDLLNAKLSVEYYNCYIWPNRYGQIVDLNALSIMMKKHKNKEEKNMLTYMKKKYFEQN